MHMTWFRCFRQTFRKVSDFKHEQWVQIAHGHGHSTLKQWLQIVHHDCAMDCFSAFFPALKDVVVLVGKVLWTFCLLLARCCPGSVPECIWTKPFVSQYLWLFKNWLDFCRGLSQQFYGFNLRRWFRKWVEIAVIEDVEQGVNFEWDIVWSNTWWNFGLTVLPANLSNLHSSFAKDFEYDL